MAWKFRIVGPLLVVLLATAGLVLFQVLEDVEDESRRVESMSHLRPLVMLMTDQEASPQHTGKNSILYFVATGAVDPSDEHDLGILFSPNDRDLWPRPGAEAYADVTRESLRTRRFPHLTSYAGPNRPVGDLHAVGRGQPTLVIPLVGDFSFGDHVIVGFSDGSIRDFDREDLDLDPDEPITAGSGSKSPITQQLSLE